MKVKYSVNLIITQQMFFLMKLVRS